MKRLLVTGGAGFIGANFVNYWLERHSGDTVVVLDLLTHAGDPANLAPARKHAEYTFVRGNICDTPLVEQLMRLHRVDTIVHFAEESLVDRSIAGSDTLVQTNIVGTHSLLKAARKLWLDHKLVPTHRFHLVSTDEVYGSLRRGGAPVAECTPYAPDSPYLASKAASVHLVRAYHHTHGLDATIGTSCDNYGPFQSPGKMIPLIINQVLQGEPLRIHGDGRYVRDWLHVRDHCRAIDAILSRGRSGEIYNIGGRAECEHIRLVRMLCTMVDEVLSSNPTLRAMFPRSASACGSNSESLIHFVKNLAGHDGSPATNCSKIEIDCDSRPEISLDVGLAATVGWYLRQVQAKGGERRRMHDVGQDAA
jgi:dTDP-glucose 4,6-dehydratase